MTPGSILHDKNFKFRDGTTGNKLLVVLNDGAGGLCIVLKTTSQEKGKKRTLGCHLYDRPPNFFIPQGRSWFDLDTWVELNNFFEIDTQSLSALPQPGTLPADILKDLLVCAIASQDISIAQTQILQGILAALN